MIQHLSNDTNAIAGHIGHLEERFQFLQSGNTAQEQEWSYTPLTKEELIEISRDPLPVVDSRKLQKEPVKEEQTITETEKLATKIKHLLTEKWNKIGEERRKMDAKMNREKQEYMQALRDEEMQLQDQAAVDEAVLEENSVTEALMEDEKEVPDHWEDIDIDMEEDTKMKPKTVEEEGQVLGKRNRSKEESTEEGEKAPDGDRDQTTVANVITPVRGKKTRSNEPISPRPDQPTDFLTQDPTTVTHPEGVHERDRKEGERV